MVRMNVVPQVPTYLFVATVLLYIDTVYVFDFDIWCDIRQRQRQRRRQRQRQGQGQGQGQKQGQKQGQAPDQATTQAPAQAQAQATAQANPLQVGAPSRGSQRGISSEVV